MNDFEGAASTLVPGRLRGYREWNLTSPADDVLLLASLTARTIWPWTPVQTARCQLLNGWMSKYEQEHGPVPSPICRCGIYALNKPVFGQYGPDAAPVAGVIEAWGRVELGERGFRAQHARIAALWVRPVYRPKEPFEIQMPDIRTLKPGEGFEVSLRFLSTEVEGEEAVELRAHIVASLGERYRVPMYDTVEAMLSDYPPIDLSALRSNNAPPSS